MGQIQTPFGTCGVKHLGFVAIQSVVIIIIIIIIKLLLTSRGHAVAQLVEALHYKTEGRGFDSRWCH
jgi:hypothetical protein